MSYYTYSCFTIQIILARANQSIQCSKKTSTQLNTRKLFAKIVGGVHLAYVLHNNSSIYIKSQLYHIIHSKSLIP